MKKIKKRLKKVLTFQNQNDILNKSLGGDGKEKKPQSLINKGLATIRTLTIKQ